MPHTVEPSFDKVDYRNLDNITLNVDNETGHVIGYTTYGGISDDSEERSYYFENASLLLPKGFFEEPFESFKYVLLKDPYEVRRNPDYEKIKEEREEEERRRREESTDKDTVSREEYEKLKAELEEIKKLLRGGK